MVETCWKRIGFSNTIHAFPSELQSSSSTEKETEVSEQQITSRKYFI
jgi:hypothetical protein